MSESTTGQMGILASPKARQPKTLSLRVSNSHDGIADVQFAELKCTTPLAPAYPPDVQRLRRVRCNLAVETPRREK